MTWMFSERPNVAVFTTRRVLEGREPVVLVTHDGDDGAWQFHGASDTADEDARITSLESMVRSDPTLGVLHDLGVGWSASRASVADTWERAPSALTALETLGIRPMQGGNFGASGTHLSQTTPSRAEHRRRR